MVATQPVGYARDKAWQLIDPRALPDTFGPARPDATGRRARRTPGELVAKVAKLAAKSVGHDVHVRSE